MEETNKWVCMLAYIVFFIPIAMERENENYRFHCNQGFLLLMLTFVIISLGIVIPVIGWFILLPVGGVMCLSLAVIGVSNAYNQKMKELPIIGKFRVLFK